MKALSPSEAIKKAQAKAVKEHLERLYWMLLRQHNLDRYGFVKQFKIPDLRWIYDFALPPSRILIEIQGGIWMPKSGHNTGRGIIRDTTKSNDAEVLGWHVLHFTEKHLLSGEAIIWTKSAILAFPPF